MKKSEIKRLEYELGRYQKKVADQEKQIAGLKTSLYEANQGNRETQSLVDAILTAVAIQYGEAAEDPDQPGEFLGKRLVLPYFNFAEMREKYEIHARRDEQTNDYIIGVMERENK